MECFPDVLIRRGRRKTLHGRLVRIGRTNYVLRTSGRKRTSGKLSYGPKEGRPLNVVSECDVLWTTLAEWEGSHTFIYLFLFFEGGGLGWEYKCIMDVVLDLVRKVHKHSKVMQRMLG